MYVFIVNREHCLIFSKLLQLLHASIFIKIVPSKLKESEVYVDFTLKNCQMLQVMLILLSRTVKCHYLYLENHEIWMTLLL